MLNEHRKTIFEALGRGAVHPFPARMAPGIVLDVLARSKHPLRVLDPMMGSGTVVALARSMGHKAHGVDIDPLSVLISTVWTTTTNPEAVRTIAQRVLKRARRNFRSLKYGNSYPRHADDETRRFVRYWFDPYVRRQMTALSRAISRVRNEKVRNVLWCALSRLIIAKQAGASLALDLAHSRPHKYFTTAPTKPFRRFMEAVEHILANCVRFNQRDRGPAPKVKVGDARDLSLKDCSIDLVLTSPPYLNAIDYLRCSKFSLVWMGYNIKRLRWLRAESVGSEVGDYQGSADSKVRAIVGSLQLSPRLMPRHEALLARYVKDIERSVSEVARVLSPGGKAIYVIGENTVRGTFIRNSKIVEAIARHCGLQLSARQIRMLPTNRRYLPPPSRNGRSVALNSRLRREVVLAFRKPGPAA